MNIKDMLKAAGFIETVRSETLTEWTVDTEPIGVVELKYEIINDEITVIGELQLPDRVTAHQTTDKP